MMIGAIPAAIMLMLSTMSQADWGMVEWRIAEDLARRVDIPFCRADLTYITKLAIALERRNFPEQQ